jgi:hypothetical protein
MQKTEQADQKTIPKAASLTRSMRTPKIPAKAIIALDWFIGCSDITAEYME